MEKLKYYDEAANNFYSNSEIKSFTINSLDFHASHFNKVCENLHDLKNLTHLAAKKNWHGALSIRDQILRKEHVVVVTDPNLNIVYASQNMYGMNGYRPTEVLGKKPSMFQGAETNEETRKLVSMAIKNREPFEVVLVNYRKNGAPYKCWIQGSPIFDKKGKVVNFIAFEKEVA
ncbi:PAS domain-containing protein [Flagellimonas sp. S3867]|uniref:PAS domain-containing protein n=1 Tax=Flagellimonas sp. S3867 TaxID=2768063 RepID=UPI0016893C0D|nr:PAS domain-containing protein [Flagellimonas sp. S3867]